MVADMNKTIYVIRFFKSKTPRVTTVKIKRPCGIIYG